MRLLQLKLQIILDAACAPDSENNQIWGETRWHLYFGILLPAAVWVKKEEIGCVFVKQTYIVLHFNTWNKRRRNHISGFCKVTNDLACARRAHKWLAPLGSPGKTITSKWLSLEKKKQVMVRQADRHGIVLPVVVEWTVPLQTEDGDAIFEKLQKWFLRTTIFLETTTTIFFYK